MLPGVTPYGTQPYGATPLAPDPAAATPANVLFLSPRDIDRASLTASTAVTSLPVTYLQNQEPTKKWRSTAGGVQYIDVVMQELRACNAGVVVGHNLSAAGLLRITGYIALADVGVSAVVDTGWQSAWPSTGKHDDPDWAHELSLLLWSNDAALQYWRIEIADPTLDYIEAGRIALGRAYQPSINADIEVGIGFVPNDVQESNGYGQTFTDPRPFAQRQFDVPFSAADESDVHAAAMELSRLRGQSGDIICCLDPGATTRFHRWSMQGLFTSGTKFKSQPLFTSGGQMWGFSFTLIEKI